MRRVTFCVLACLMLLLCGGWAWGKPGSDPVEAKVELLLDQDYLPRVLELLRGARKEIRVVIYYIGDPEQAAPKALLEALADAKGRGVAVSVLLDAPAEGEEDRNQAALAWLKGRGIPVSQDGKDLTTHTKALVVDAEWIVLGSANWTQGALKHNHEAGALIRSPQLARRMLGAFDRDFP